MKITIEAPPQSVAEVLELVTKALDNQLDINNKIKECELAKACQFISRNFSR